MSRLLNDPRLRLLRMVGKLWRPPAGRGRIALASVYGLICHAVFAVAVASMIYAMFFGMRRGLGSVPQPWAWVVNILLILQFPVVHSALLTDRGRRFLARLAPHPRGRTLATTSYAIIASVQLIALFVLWTPSGIVWWVAEGWGFGVICAAYTGAWLLLIKASFDAGAEVQSGALGWMSLYQNIRVRFPDMPELGLFRIIRQPIYVAFALTLWTVPVWTPDQLLLASLLTVYCLAGPLLKERRFARLYGARFAAYRRRTPYAIPSLPPRIRRIGRASDEAGKEKA